MTLQTFLNFTMRGHLKLKRNFLLLSSTALIRFINPVLQKCMHRKKLYIQFMPSVGIKIAKKAYEKTAKLPI